MHLIVGLGNPGPKYTFTRHNIGFMVLDAIHTAARNSKEAGSIKNEHQALTFRIGSEILFAQPQTFMNLSGDSVQALLSFYKIPVQNLLVIHDEIDLSFGQLRLQKGRGHGGHNGIRHIHEKIGPDYARLKLGVGRPTLPQMGVADYVLQNFSKDEGLQLPDFLQRACDGVFSFIENGFERTQNKFNTKV